MRIFTRVLSSLMVIRATVSDVLPKVAPRNGPTDITLFRDFRGGVGDLALVNYVYERARELGRGVEVDL